MHSQPTSNVLRAVKVLSIASSECADDYSEYDLTVTRRMFCAMTEDKDSCQVRSCRVCLCCVLSVSCLSVLCDVCQYSSKRM